MWWVGGSFPRRGTIGRSREASAASSRTVFASIENQRRKIEELDATIRSAEKSLHRQTVKEDDIEAYFAVARKTMELPREAIFSAEAKPKLEKLWGFIFRERPTWGQILDGTPQLTLIYRLNRDVGPDQNQLAGELSRHWNPFEAEVRAALQGFGTVARHHQSPAAPLISSQYLV